MRLHPLSLAFLFTACVDFGATEADVCRARPDLCDVGGGVGGGSATGGGAAGGGSATGGGAMGGGSATGGGSAVDAGQVNLGWSTAAAFTGFLDAGQERTLQLTNSGTRASNLITLAFERGGDAGFRIVSTACGAVLGPGQPCNTTVRFEPADEGTVMADLLATDGESSTLVTLTGTGVDYLSHVTLVTRFELDAGGVVVTQACDGGACAVCDGGTCTFDLPRSSAVTTFEAQPAGGSMVRWTNCENTAASTVCDVRPSARFLQLEALFTRPNPSFVTSSLVSPASLGSSGAPEVVADAICQAHALDAGLPGTFKALLSHRLDAGAGRYAASEVFAANAGWERPDGRPFLLGALTGRPAYPPVLDEHGTRITGNTYVMTGNTSLLPGSGATATGRDCLNWSVAAATYTAGRATNERQWMGVSPELTCTQAARLYCLGTGRLGASELRPQPPSRRAFCLADVPLSQGRAVMDARCSSAAGRDAGYLAAVALPGEAPLARFDAGGPPWVRSDGVWLATTAAALWQPDAGLLAAPWINAQRYGDPDVLGCGARIVLGSEGLTVPGASAGSCAGWSSTTGLPTAVSGADLTLPFFTSGYSCAEPHPVLCLEE